jgi:alpha,alpha-trehalase
MSDYQNLILKVKTTLAPFKAFIKRPAKGYLKYDYLVPSGYYQEQWDWDAFFMGVGLSAGISSEAIYLRNWALNYITLAKKDGYSPGCVTPKGAEKGHRAILMKPFIGQGSYLASVFLNDFSWIKPHYQKLVQMVLYREKKVWNKKYDLGVWTTSMESGADDNVAAFNFPKKSVVASDVNTFIYREYQALSKIAEELGKTGDAEGFDKRAKEIKRNINKYLWNDKDQIYYNLFSKTGQHIKRISYSCFIPLWGKIAGQKEGKSMISRYLLSTKHMLSKYGGRTLSKQDSQYNNVNRIKPFSNWQGPVWPIANYMYMHGLLNYGFQKEAVKLAITISKLVLDDIKNTGGMHENYDAESGKPLASPGFVSWNILVGNMLEEAITHKNPFLI